MTIWTSPICLSIFELIILVGAGRRLGVDYIWTLTEKIIDRFNNSEK